MDTQLNEEKVVLDAAICSGKPCIRGTRIMVKNILGMIAGGYDIARVTKEYPELSKEDVVAALEYATQAVDDERIIRRA